MLLSLVADRGHPAQEGRGAASRRTRCSGSSTSTFDGTARKTFADVTRAIANQTSPLTGQQKQFAIVLDGKVISAPTVNGVIPNGQARDQRQLHPDRGADAGQQPEVRRAAAEVRRSPVVTEEGPTLAADQLSAGLIAGAIGLGPGADLLPALLPRPRPGGGRRRC